MGDIQNENLKNSSSTEKDEKDEEKISDTKEAGKNEAVKTEVDENPNNLKSNVFYIEVVDKKEKESSDTPSIPAQTPRRINKLRDHSSNIFPAGCMGCREDPPSDHITSPRRFLDPYEAKDRIGHIDSTPRKRPSSAKPRNPVTGVGVDDAEIKRSTGRRKDGNPLLGEGYEMKEISPSCTRIPPGGYSQGLW